MTMSAPISAQKFNSSGFTAAVFLAGTQGAYH
jgi:hypothetical protein